MSADKLRIWIAPGHAQRGYDPASLDSLNFDAENALPEMGGEM